MENAMITMKNINKGYMLGEERLPILKDINFQVNKGEYVAILGPSGSGKTTLMNMIGCMDVMDSGEYYLDGMAIPSRDANFVYFCVEKAYQGSQARQPVPSMDLPVVHEQFHDCQIWLNSKSRHPASNENGPWKYECKFPHLSYA